MATGSLVRLPGMSTRFGKYNSKQRAVAVRGELQEHDPRGERISTENREVIENLLCMSGGSSYMGLATDMPEGYSSDIVDNALKAWSNMEPEGADASTTTLWKDVRKVLGYYSNELAKAEDAAQEPELPDDDDVDPGEVTSKEEDDHKEEEREKGEDSPDFEGTRSVSPKVLRKRPLVQEKERGKKTPSADGDSRSTDKASPWEGPASSKSLSTYRDAAERGRQQVADSKQAGGKSKGRQALKAIDETEGGKTTGRGKGNRNRGRSTSPRAVRKTDNAGDEGPRGRPRPMSAGPRTAMDKEAWQLAIDENWVPILETSYQVLAKSVDHYAPEDIQNMGFKFFKFKTSMCRHGDRCRYHKASMICIFAHTEEDFDFHTGRLDKWLCEGADAVEVENFITNHLQITPAEKGRASYTSMPFWEYCVTDLTPPPQMVPGKDRREGREEREGKDRTTSPPRRAIKGGDGRKVQGWGPQADAACEIQWDEEWVEDVVSPSLISHSPLLCVDRTCDRQGCDKFHTVKAYLGDHPLRKGPDGNGLFMWVQGEIVDANNKSSRAPGELSLRKSKLCVKFKEGKCTFGDSCKYAHGWDDVTSSNHTTFAIHDVSHEEPPFVEVPETDMAWLGGAPWLKNTAVCLQLPALQFRMVSSMPDGLDLNKESHYHSAGAAQVGTMYWHHFQMSAYVGTRGCLQEILHNYFRGFEPCAIWRAKNRWVHHDRDQWDNKYPFNLGLFTPCCGAHEEHNIPVTMQCFAAMAHRISLLGFKNVMPTERVMQSAGISYQDAIMHMDSPTIRYRNFRRMQKARQWKYLMRVAPVGGHDWNRVEAQFAGRARGSNYLLVRPHDLEHELDYGFQEWL